MKQMLEVFYSKIKNKERTPNSSTHLMGLKDRFGNVLEEPRFRYHIYNNQGLYFLAESCEEEKYINAVCYNNKNGKYVGKYEELYFVQNGLIIVKSVYRNFFGQYSYMLPNGKTAGTPFMSVKDACINTIQGLKDSIECIGAIALKYAKREMLSEEKLDNNTVTIYKEALKKYLIFSDLFDKDDKTDDEIKALIHKEFNLFNNLITQKDNLVIKNENQNMNRINLKNYIDDLIK